jgi:hypothetical protein
VALSAELFQGQTAFKPKTWALKAAGVFDLNYVATHENNQVDVDVREGKTRRRHDFGFEEAFGEVLLKTLSSHYDFVSARVGIQPFVSDFRGLVFSDDGVSFHHLPVVRPGSSSSISPTSVAVQGSRIYAGTSDGLLLSTDGGATFTERTFGLYDANRVTCVAASGRDVLVGTATALHVSHDRFRTSGPRYGAVSDLTFDGDDVYAITGAGAFAVSRDRGDSWTTVALPGGAGTAYAVASQGDYVYVGTAGGVAISSDRAATFGTLVPLDGNPVTRVGAGDWHCDDGARHPAFEPTASDGEGGGRNAQRPLVIPRPAWFARKTHRGATVIEAPKRTSGLRGVLHF